jgi:antitoxin ParD1/3/4
LREIALEARFPYSQGQSTSSGQVAATPSQVSAGSQAGRYPDYGERAGHKVGVVRWRDVWYDTSMTAAKIAITLPQHQLLRVRRAVRAGQAESVSGYIAHVLEQHEERESLHKLLDDLTATHGEPTKEERAWARRALARHQRR